MNPQQLHSKILFMRQNIKQTEIQLQRINGEMENALIADPQTGVVDTALYNRLSAEKAQLESVLAKGKEKLAALVETENATTSGDTDYFQSVNNSNSDANDSFTHEIGSNINNGESIPKLNAGTIKGSVFGLPPVYADSAARYKAIVASSFFIIKMSPIILSTNSYSFWEQYTPNKIKPIPYNDVLDLMSQVLYGTPLHAYKEGSFYWFNFAVTNGRITEAFSNEYGESYYQQRASEVNLAGATAFQMRQAPGTDTSIGQDIMQTLHNLKQMFTFTHKGQVKSRGWKQDFPKIWMGSSWQMSDAFSIRLISPSDRPADIFEWVIKPAFILKMLASPISEVAGDVFHNPPFLQVKIPYVGELPLAGISNLTITWGGDTGAFSMDQLPLIADISLQFECLNSASQTTREPVTFGAMPNTKRAIDFMVNNGFNDTVKSTNIYNNMSKIEGSNSNKENTNTNTNTNTSTNPTSSDRSQSGSRSQQNNTDLSKGYNNVKLGR